MHCSLIVFAGCYDSFKMSQGQYFTGNCLPLRARLGYAFIQCCSATSSGKLAGGEFQHRNKASSRTSKTVPSKGTVSVVFAAGPLQLDNVFKGTKENWPFDTFAPLERGETYSNALTSQYTGSYAVPTSKKIIQSITSSLPVL
jgi:hypothetical protein